MTINEWLKGNGKIMKDTATRLLRYNAGTILNHVQPYLKKIRYGPSPMEQDWELLIVLDGCRHDALQRISERIDFLPNEIPITRSSGSWSRSWLTKSFQPDEYREKMRDTGFVAWNPFISRVCNEDNWGVLWKVYNEAWDDRRGLVPPREITDRTIDLYRNHDELDRIIAWYQQPHQPFRQITQDVYTKDEIGVFDPDKTVVWDRVKNPRDEVTRQDAWNAYIDNLQWVLDEVGMLLENFDSSEVVLTSDHGELIGEWFGYGHGPGMPFPELIHVPWVELKATDEGTRQPDMTFSGESRHDRVKERLMELGYLEKAGANGD